MNNWNLKFKKNNTVYSNTEKREKYLGITTTYVTQHLFKKKIQNSDEKDLNK